MPARPPKPCAHPGCVALVRKGRCPAHERIAGSFADAARGTSTERGYGSAWRRLRLRVLRRDCGLCQPCLRANRVTLAQQVDHIIPKAEGGSDDMENLEAICAPCHNVKTQRESMRSRSVA